MKILFIGGTRFMGYFATQSALARGHDVTLFTRGKSSPDAFPNAENIHGDRDADIELLRGRKFDAVIDTSGYFPRVVRKSAELLAENVGQYLFISSISVYAEPLQPGGDENSPVIELSDPTVEDLEFYGGLKVLCERVVEEVLPGRATNVRAGLIAGPRDLTGRFDYWVRRVAQGGEVLAPATPDRRAQFIDARDLGEWVVRAVESKTMGIYNATGPDKPLTMGEVLDTCKTVSGSDAKFTWVDEKFLLEHEVEPWTGLPLWVPEDIQAIHMANVSRAVAAGLTFRPLADTVAATLAYLNEDMKAALERQQHTLPAEREQALLKEWREKLA